jgi:hypothetical protein
VLFTAPPGGPVSEVVHTPPDPAEVTAVTSVVTTDELETVFFAPDILSGLEVPLYNPLLD